MNRIYKFTPLKFLLLLLLPIVSNSAFSWNVERSTDTFSDEAITFSYATNSNQQSVNVRCKGKKFEIYIDFDEFLDNDDVAIEYRVDKEKSIKQKWSVSTKGTAVFAKDSKEIARVLRKGSSFAISARDYRGTRYLAKFSLIGSSRAITQVLESCNISVASLKDPNLPREEIRREVESWGPKSIKLNKQILNRVGSYTGPINSTAEQNFIRAIQMFYDDYITECRNKILEIESCKKLYRAWEAGLKPVMPNVSVVILELAPGKFKIQRSALNSYE